MNDRLAERTRTWIEQDPDPETSAELAGLLENEDWETVGERMAGTLEFGTAGIRGAVEAGSNRMNRAVVIRTTAGLSAFLTQSRSGPVVVGFDGRASSHQFADDAVGVLAAAGHDVHFFTEPVPTPLVAFTAKQRGAAAVVITASHNPPADNGYKVYDSNGAQIVPPVDTEIGAAIEAVEAAADVPRIEGLLDDPGGKATAIQYEDAYTAYREAVWKVRTWPHGSDLAAAYTPIHGVGWKTLDRIVRESGYDSFHTVETQRLPDGAFPTVSFPNPEEPGAMDLVVQLAEEKSTDLAIANDPDADRLAVALPGGNGWQLLTGNQIGVLLADWVLEHWGESVRPIVINSIVSSPMLAMVADLHGARFEQTLTGFKWIANAAMDLEDAGEGQFAFGYEEALGYSVGATVRDKDGISAALCFMDMAAHAKDGGRSVFDLLDDLYRRAGLWVSTQVSIVRPGTEGLAEISSAVEQFGANPPKRVGDRPVAGVTDFRHGGEGRPRWLPNTSLIALDLKGRSRVLVRPSGTEPKLKIYVDLTGPIESGEATLRAQAEDLGDKVAEFIGL